MALNYVKKILRLVRYGKDFCVILKDKSDDDTQKYVIRIYELNQAKSVLEGTILRGLEDRGKSMSLYKFITMESNLIALMVRGFRFYTEDKRYFSVFQGYPHQPAQSLDMSIIQPFLDHAKNIVFNGNAEVNDYMWKWFAFIYQNPTGMTGKEPVLIGAPGCGKNTFTNVLCQLIGSEYSKANCSDASNYFGKFNTAIENTKLGILNELADSESRNNRVDHDRLKTTVTESTIDINHKGRSQRYNVQNVFNLIVCTNHPQPLKMDPNDRRFVIIRPSDKYAENHNDTVADKRMKMKYFNDLYRSMKAPGFYEHLAAYVKSIDLTDFELNDVPITEDKLEYIELSKKPTDILFERYITKFIPKDDGCGFSNAEIFQVYRGIVREIGFSGSTLTQTQVTHTLRTDYPLTSGKRLGYGSRSLTTVFKPEGLTRYAKQIEEAREMEANVLDPDAVSIPLSEDSDSDN